MNLDQLVGFIIQQYYQCAGTSKIMSRRKLPCTRCQTFISSTWRPGPCGTSSLCNTCGVQYMRRQGRPRMIDLVMDEGQPVWMERDSATLQWCVQHTADIKDERIHQWSNHETERIEFVESKKRKFIDL